jgi:hypothetical protein
MLVHFRVGRELVTGRFDERLPAAVDETLCVGLDVDKVHLFDEESGVNVDVASPSTTLRAG